MTKIKNNIEEKIILVHEMINNKRTITDDIDEMGSTIADMNSAIIGGDEDNIEIIG